MALRQDLGCRIGATAHSVAWQYPPADAGRQILPNQANGPLSSPYGNDSARRSARSATRSTTASVAAALSRHDNRAAWARAFSA